MRPRIFSVSDFYIINQQGIPIIFSSILQFFMKKPIHKFKAYIWFSIFLKVSKKMLQIGFSWYNFQFFKKIIILY